MNNLAAIAVNFLTWALVAVPDTAKVPLPKAVAKIQEPGLVESSSLTGASLVSGRYWSLNDSGNAPELFAMDAEGRAQGKVKVEKVKNVDWEALATDGEGGLWIGDFGNNQNNRKDLVIYRVDEPGEILPPSLKVTQTIRFRFPDQRGFPPEKLNFDCEAMFLMNHKIYLLTKHRADTNTKLYRIEDLESGEMQDAVLLDAFQGIGQVTDASLSADGQRLAVLTFSGIWVFERPVEHDLFLQGAGRHFKFRNWALRQVEGISWTEDQALLLCNEQKELFRIPVDGEGWQKFSSTSAESADELP